MTIQLPERAVRTRRAASHRESRRVLVVGHRGASADLPENTIGAALRARQVGADLVEVDVRATRDGHLVVLHDETLVRTTDARSTLPARTPWRLADLDLAHVARVHTADGAPLPLLRGLIDRVPLLIDLKDPCADLLAEQLPVGADVIVQSRHVDAMRRLAMVRPDLDVAILARPGLDQLREVATWATGVHVHHLRLDRAYLEALHDHGLRCLTWTVNQPLMIERVLRLGVDGVITDRPGALVDRLARG